MKNLLLSLTLLLFSATAFAQVSFGIKAGGMLATRVTNTIDHNLEIAKLSYVGGAFYSFPIHEQFGLQVELLYANKAIEVERRRAFQLLSEDLHYLNLPVMLQYKLKERLSLELGPEVGYLIGQKQIATTGTQPPSPFMKNLDMAINLGVGYEPVNRVLLNLRYNFGIFDITKPFHEVVPGATPEEDRHRANRTLQLTVGYRLSR
ncbi:MAG: porin family protein [Cyclobacteriaceae bacterium]